MAVVLAPVSFVVTILLVPMWRWLEAAFAIEALGHSGPSSWCYFSVYGVAAAVAFTGIVLVSRRVHGGPDEPAESAKL